MKHLLIFSLLCAGCYAAAPAQAQSAQCSLQRDWKKAIWKVPLHIALSAPVAAASLTVPPIGKKYVRWRIRAEMHDLCANRDTKMKAEIDLYSQTALPRAVLRLYRIHVN